MISALRAGSSNFAFILSFRPLRPPIRVVPVKVFTALRRATGLSQREELEREIAGLEAEAERVAEKARELAGEVPF